MDLTKSTEEKHPVKNPQPAASVRVVVARPCFLSCPSLGDGFVFTGIKILPRQKSKIDTTEPPFPNHHFGYPCLFLGGVGCKRNHYQTRFKHPSAATFGTAPGRRISGSWVCGFFPILLPSWPIVSLSMLP